MDGYNYKFFRHANCEWFPCHANTNKFLNCLFCFCPLYQYDNCGGKFKILENGIKDCSECLIPHSQDGYEKIISKITEGNNSKIKNCEF